MQVNAIGVVGMKGTSKTTGKEYDFAQLNVLVPVEVVATEKMQKIGYGYEVQQVDIEPSMVSKLNTVAKWPCVLELMTEQRLGHKGIRTVVVDFKQKATAA